MMEEEGFCSTLRGGTDCANFHDEMTTWRMKLARELMSCIIRTDNLKYPYNPHLTTKQYRSRAQFLMSSGGAGRVSLAVSVGDGPK